MSTKSMKVPMPGRSLPPDQVAEARGWADAFALKLRHHNAALHARRRPADATARAVFDELEEVRVEAIGSREMEGGRSEEHTSELQSLMSISYAVFGLKKKKQ